MPRKTMLRRDEIPRDRITPAQWAELRDEAPPDGATEAERLIWDDARVCHAQNRLTLQEAWRLVSGEVLAEWIPEHPGTRPAVWWRWDAPEPRRRLGGTGTPAHEALAVAESYCRGIPDSWVTRWDVEYYNGRMVDVHGAPIGTAHREGDFPYDALDPFDPPVYESQAGFLDRHGLLTREERRVLDRDGWPGDEVVEAEPEDEEG
jgi:hypothetical protein